MSPHPLLRMLRPPYKAAVASPPKSKASFPAAQIFLLRDFLSQAMTLEAGLQNVFCKGSDLLCSSTQVLSPQTLEEEVSPAAGQNK